jgi:hypothetical protein
MDSSEFLKKLPPSEKILRELKANQERQKALRQMLKLSVRAERESSFSAPDDTQNRGDR